MSTATPTDIDYRRANGTLDEAAAQIREAHETLLAAWQLVRELNHGAYNEHELALMEAAKFAALAYKALPKNHI
jgi:hypothetical protein